MCLGECVRERESVCVWCVGVMGDQETLEPGTCKDGFASDSTIRYRHTSNNIGEQRNRAEKSIESEEQ